MHLFRACELWCLLLAVVITGPCIEFYEQKCHEAFSHADVAPAALEWSHPSHPLTPFNRPPSPSTKSACHLPPAAMPAPCDDLLLSSRPGRCIQAWSQEPRCTVPSRFFFCPDAWAWPIAICDPRICPGRTSELSSQQLRKQPQTGNKNSSSTTTTKKKWKKEDRRKGRRWDTHARIMQRQWHWQPPRALLSPVEASFLSQPTRSLVPSGQKACTTARQVVPCP